MMRYAHCQQHNIITARIKVVKKHVTLAGYATKTPNWSRNFTEDAKQHGINPAGIAPVTRSMLLRRKESTELPINTRDQLKGIGRYTLLTDGYSDARHKYQFYTGHSRYVGNHEIVLERDSSFASEILHERFFLSNYLY
uniref:Uncharacterized protein n=1 Tax=Caenorhabditis japonica TaxID=281687 RepID=A0A8R1E321_CAEJA